MALGYTIATILKRSSHIFYDDRVCVKTDWLEQLNRKYVQVLFHLIQSFAHLSLPNPFFFFSLSLYSTECLSSELGSVYYLSYLIITCQSVLLCH